MDNRIDRPGAALGSAGLRAVDLPLREGRGGGGPVERAGLGGGGRRGVSSWRVNLAGPFDPNAPRGTYLDILV